ncbi:MAG: hypothetical protein VKJ87_02160 [Synechococcus sp.]|nr:hypothetical protein [Synechococcus sp.]
MPNTLGLSLNQAFDIERMGRAIDAEADLTVLRSLAKKLLGAWQSQQAATRWLQDQQRSSTL